MVVGVFFEKLRLLRTSLVSTWHVTEIPSSRSPNVSSSLSIFKLASRSNFANAAFRCWVPDASMIHHQEEEMPMRAVAKRTVQVYLPALSRLLFFLPPQVSALSFLVSILDIFSEI